MLKKIGRTGAAALAFSLSAVFSPADLMAEERTEGPDEVNEVSEMLAMAGKKDVDRDRSGPEGHSDTGMMRRGGGMPPDTMRRGDDPRMPGDTVNDTLPPGSPEDRGASEPVPMERTYGP